jgi:tRNA nucleotidyltransferase (CCA-adding enzyme)
MAETKVKRVKKGISVYFTHLRDLTITLTGKDLKKMGFTPGPIYREILDAVMDARLDGLVKTRNDEFKFVKKYYA